MKRTDQSAPPDSPRTSVHATAWDDDDNKPAIPKIPGPRKPERLTTPLPPAAQAAITRLQAALATPPATGRRVIAAGYVRRAPQPVPNPEAAALYTQAAADYENAARDADRLGHHQRADAHRSRARYYRSLVGQYRPAVTT